MCYNIESDIDQPFFSLQTALADEGVSIAIKKKNQYWQLQMCNNEKVPTLIVWSDLPDKFGQHVSLFKVPSGSEMCL